MKFCPISLGIGARFINVSDIIAAIASDTADISRGVASVPLLVAKNPAIGTTKMLPIPPTHIISPVTIPNNLAS